MPSIADKSLVSRVASLRSPELLNDAASVMAFAALARFAHREKLGFTAWGVMQTAWPFLTGMMVGWLINTAASRSPRKVAPAGVTVWLSTVVTGLTIWGIKHHAVPHWSFMMVAGSTSAALLLGWRGLGRRCCRHKK